MSLGEGYQKAKYSYLRLKELIEIPIECNGLIRLQNIESIEFKNISFAYNNADIINSISYKFEKGNIYCVVGSNGCGKSTLIDLILGILNENYKGTIFYNNNNIVDLDMYFIRKNLISVVEQEPTLIPHKIYDNLTYNCNISNADDVSKLLNKFNLDTMINLLPDGINTVIYDDCKNISGGEKQKISIINALLNNSDLLVLDEPSSALDFKSMIALKETLYNIRNNKIIIIVTHDNNLIELADYIVKL